MAVTQKRLGQSAALATSATTLYTVPSSTSTIVKNIAIANLTANDATVTLTISGIPILSVVTILARSTTTLDVAMVMNASETITALTGTASALSIFVSGVEVV